MVSGTLDTINRIKAFPSLSRGVMETIMWYRIKAFLLIWKLTFITRNLSATKCCLRGETGDDKLRTSGLPFKITCDSSSISKLPDGQASISSRGGWRDKVFLACLHLTPKSRQGSETSRPGTNSSGLREFHQGAPLYISCRGKTNYKLSHKAGLMESWVNDSWEY